MVGVITSTFPWAGLSLFVFFLVGGLVFSNQDMLEENLDNPATKEEKCRSKDCS